MNEEALKESSKRSAKNFQDRVKKLGPITHGKKNEHKTDCNRTITYYMKIGTDRVTCLNCKKARGWG